MRAARDKRPASLGDGLRGGPPGRGPSRRRGPRQAQGRQAPQRQPAFERVARLTKRRGDGADPVDRLTRADHHAQGQVAVAADQLCHRMHDEGRPQLDRPAQERGERVVHHQGHAGPAGNPGGRFQVRDSQQRVGDGLDEHQPGSRRDQLFQRLGAGRIEAVVGHPEPDELSGHERRALAVQSLRDDHVIALADQRHREEKSRDAGIYE